MVVIRWRLQQTAEERCEALRSRPRHSNSCTGQTAATCPSIQTGTRLLHLRCRGSHSCNPEMTTGAQQHCTRMCLEWRHL